jgi:ribose transport system ATP-binding protein
MSIASGMQNATSGEMYFHGQPWTPKSMIEAQEKGISMILQESNAIPGVTVAQNIFAGQEEKFSNAGMINMRRMYQAADELLEKFGIGHIKGRDMMDQYKF